MRQLAICLLLISSLIACGPKEVHSAMNTTGDSWPEDISQVFEFEISEQGNYASHIFLKHNNNYGYRNLFLFSTLTYPDGNSRTDTMQYYLSQPDGKWLGKGWGELKTIKLLFPPKLDQVGKYKLDLRQGMREAKLEGIEQIGLTIEVLN